MAAATGSGENHSLAKFQHDFIMRWNHLSGNTALHEAAWKGFSQTIEILAKHKINLNIKNKNGNTALHLACQQGHNQSCRNLLIYGAKPDIKNNYGDTALHTAARYGHAGVVRILISAFCNVNEVNKNGDTALHISSAMGRRKLTRILLETGCNPAIKNKQGETAMDIALRKNFKEVQEIIAAIPVKDPPQSKRHKQKNGSLQSQESRQSREERHKSKFSSKDQHKAPYHSPYGCPMLPDAKDFPQPRISSLPAEPLRKGEQYYIDLAGNIRKGPVGKVYNCYCVPLIEKVEKKLEKEKKELKEEIENCRTNLNDKISSLERKTNFQMVSLNETVKSRLPNERTTCAGHSSRSNLKQKLDYERSQLQQVEQFKNQMKCILESRLNQPNVRKYQPNPARHSNKTHLDGLINQNGLKGSSNGTVSSVVVNQSILLDDSKCTYDRPKSCLGYNRDFIPTVTYYNDKNCLGLDERMRSKSETHLVSAPGETIGTNDHQPEVSRYTRNPDAGVCIGTTQAEVYYDATHLCSEESEEDEEKVQPSQQNSTIKNDMDNKGHRSDAIDSSNQAVDTNGIGKSDIYVNSLNVKNIYDLPTHGHLKVSAGDVKVVSDCKELQLKRKPIQKLPSSQSTSSNCPPEEIVVDHSGDLMKSLRCNIVPRGNHDYRNSPFSDSGFRSKYSPSPREGTLTESGPIYPEPKLSREPFITSHNPPINFPPSSISQLNDRPPFSREPLSTRLNMVTPASSLV